MVLQNRPDVVHMLRRVENNRQIFSSYGDQSTLFNQHVAWTDLTGVHLSVLVAGTHEDLWDDLMPSRFEEHVLALLVAEDWHGDVLEDGGKNPTLAQSSPPGGGERCYCLQRRSLTLPLSQTLRSVGHHCLADRWEWCCRRRWPSSQCGPGQGRSHRWRSCTWDGQLFWQPSAPSDGWARWKIECLDVSKWTKNLAEEKSHSPILTRICEIIRLEENSVFTLYIYIWRQKKENATIKSTTAINQSIDKSTTKQEQQKQNSLVNTVPGSCDPVLIDKSSPTPVSWGETKEGGSSHRNLEKWEELVKNIFATDVWMKSYIKIFHKNFFITCHGNWP